MEYRYAGDVFLEVFCNPNIWATPFAAKVLITVRDDRLRVTTEAELSRLRDDLAQYIEQVGWDCQTKTRPLIKVEFLIN